MTFYGWAIQIILTAFQGYHIVIAIEFGGGRERGRSNVPDHVAHWLPDLELCLFHVTLEVISSTWQLVGFHEICSEIALCLLPR